MANKGIVIEYNKNNDTYKLRVPKFKVVEHDENHYEIHLSPDEMGDCHWSVECTALEDKEYVDPMLKQEIAMKDYQSDLMSQATRDNTE